MMKEDKIYDWIKEERIYWSRKYTTIYLAKQMQDFRMRESGNAIAETHNMSYGKPLLLYENYFYIELSFIVKPKNADVQIARHD